MYTENNKMCKRCFFALRKIRKILSEISFSEALKTDSKSKCDMIKNNNIAAILIGLTVICYLTQKWPF